MTSLNAIVRQYMTTHDNNTPPIRSLPKQPLCLREVFIGDCSVLKARDGADNQAPFAHLVCLHPAGEVRKEQVVDSFAYVRPVRTADNEATTNALEDVYKLSEIPIEPDAEELAIWETEIVAQPARVEKQTRRVRREKTADAKPALQLRAHRSAGGGEQSSHRKQRLSRKRVAREMENASSSSVGAHDVSLPSVEGLNVLDELERQERESNIDW